MRWLVVFFLVGCNRSSCQPQSSFTDDVSEAYRDCDSAAIEKLKKETNMQTVFSNCGSNGFRNFAWSNDGFLYAELSGRVQILNAETKEITPIGMAKPLDKPLWFSADKLIVPVAPDAQIGDPDNETKPERLGIYNPQKGGISYIDLPIRKTRNLHRWDEQTILLTGEKDGGSKKPYLFDLNNQTLTPTFDYVSSKFDQMGYIKEKDLLTVVHDQTLDIYRNGERIATVPEVNRAIPNADGRYIAIEVDGEIIKPEDRPLPKNLTEEQKRREKIRRKQKYDKLPNWAKDSKPPPEIHVIDLNSNERIRFLDFYGKKFEWYAPHPLLHGSMILQGISQKKINQNIGFIRIEEFLIEVELGRPPDNVEVVGKIK